MKKIKIIFLFFAVSLFQITGYSQINVTLSGCGLMTFYSFGTDATGRNIYRDGSGAFAVQWNATSNEWEIVQLPSSVGYLNTFASTPNPPCFGTGTWTLVSPGCGDVVGFTGNCQLVLTGIDEVSIKNEINVFLNPCFGQINIEGL